MDDACIFCRIVARGLPARIVYEDEELLAFHDINPRAPLHVLVVPKAHVDSLASATDAPLVGRLALRAAAIAREHGYGDRGFLVMSNTGPESGQTVPHLHFHLLAGREGLARVSPIVW